MGENTEHKSFQPDDEKIETESSTEEADFKAKLRKEHNLFRKFLTGTDQESEENDDQRDEREGANPPKGDS